MSDPRARNHARGTPHEYDRPQQPWACGLSPERPPCALGPTAWGKCPAAAECVPRKEGDRWYCNRAALHGGPCDVGPTPHGSCGLPVLACAPRRNLRVRRGQFTWLLAALAFGGACLLLNSPWRNDTIAPGELTAAHSQILQSAGAQRCEACHPAASGGVTDWVTTALRRISSTSTDSTDVQEPDDAPQTMSGRCLACHKNSFPAATAMYPHGVHPDELARRTDPMTGMLTAGAHHASSAHLHAHIACSTCHREHRGRNHALSRLTNEQCQTCHARQFASLADGHPEFTSWPTAKSSRIAFDHNRHRQLHFTKSGTRFECRLCHTSGDPLQVQAVTDYESACAECHDKSMAPSLAIGMPVFALPILDTEQLAAEGAAVGQWPERASGEFDGQLPAIVRALLQGDERLSHIWRQFPPGFDWLDLNTSDDGQLQATSELAWGIKRLFHELARNGQTAIRARLERALGRPLRDAEFQDAVAQLPWDVIALAVGDWFPNLDRELEQRGEGQRIEANEQAAAAIESAALREGIVPEYPDRMAASQVPAGGWFRDPAVVAIGYRPVRHGDQFVQTWMELLAELDRAAEHSVENRNALLRDIASTTLVGQCTVCHAVTHASGDDAGAFATSITLCWQASGAATLAAHRSTRFDHGPHLVLPSLADCQHCHPLAQVQADDVDPSVAWLGYVRRDFAPLQRSHCTSCHAPDSAGDQCTQCHRYHR